MSEKPLLPYEWPGSYYIGEEEIEAVNKVLLARSPFQFYGPDLQHTVKQLEAAYRQRLGRVFALAVNSGTAALSIALNAMDVGPGDEVLLPGYLWVSCISAVVRAGAIPRLVDIDDTFFMDPADLERKITSHSKVVMVVNMSGTTGHIDQVVDIAHAHNLYVLEDAAQANGASFHGKPLGSFGDMAIFSFQFNKNMTAGEGGLIACDDQTLYDRAVAFHDLGYPRSPEGRLVTDRPDYQFWGQGSRMNELSAAMLVSQERKLDTITEAMRRLNRRLSEGLSGVAGCRPRRVLDPSGDSGPFVLLIWPDSATCQRMVNATRAAGVVTGPLGINNIPMTEWGLHLYYNNVSLTQKRGINSAGRPWTDSANAFAAGYTYARGTLEQADDLFSLTSLLSVAPALTDDACDRVIAIFHQAAADLGL